MSPELALLDEVWDIVKSHVHEKERLDVCESIFRTFVEHIGIEDVEVYKNEFDSIMKAVIIAAAEEEEDEEEDWDY